MYTVDNTASLVVLASTARTQLDKVGPKAYTGAFWQPLYGPCMTLEDSQQPARISCVLVLIEGGKPTNQLKKNLLQIYFA